MTEEHEVRKSISTAGEEEWDLEIKSKPVFFDLNIKELWRYKDLMFLFVRRDFLAQYKQTILGPLWHFIQPILTVLIFLLIFGRIAKIPTDGITPILFYLSGFTLWNFFSITITNISSTFITNASIFGKVYFPRLIIPFSVVISNTIRFGIQLLLLLTLMIWFQFHGVDILFSVRWLLIFPLIFLTAGIGLALGIIVSSLTNKYRDLSVLLSFAVQLGMYATPVVYPLSYLQNSRFKWVIEINPLTPIIETFRYALFGRGYFDLAYLSYSAAFMLVTLIIGLFVFNRVEKTFMDTV